MRIQMFIVILLFLSGAALQAQEAGEDLQDLKAGDAEEAFIAGRSQMASGEKTVDEADAEKEKRGQFHMMMGTSFGYAPGYGSAMSIYAAPTYSLALNQRWSLHGGVMAANHMGLNYAGETPGVAPPSTMQFAVFVAASYQASDRLTVHGSGVKNLASIPYTPLSRQVMDQFTVGATYKLGDNVSIGASISIVSGNPYSPYGDSFGSNPFMPVGTPYSSPFGW